MVYTKQAKPAPKQAKPAPKQAKPAPKQAKPAPKQAKPAPEPNPKPVKKARPALKVRLPGEPSNSRHYVPVPPELKKKTGPKPGFAKRQSTAKTGPRRQLTPIKFETMTNEALFPTVEAMAKKAEGYRKQCNENEDVPTIAGFCLFCGKSSSLMKWYADECNNKELNEAARTLKSWILEQKEQAAARGEYPVNLIIWTGVNDHNKVNTRSWVESKTDTTVSGGFTLSALLDQTDSGGLPPPPGMARQIKKQAENKAFPLIEAEPADSVTVELIENRSMKSRKQ